MYQEDASISIENHRRNTEVGAATDQIVIEAAESGNEKRSNPPGCGNGVALRCYGLGRVIAPSLADETRAAYLANTPVA
jgi:hypothetical protein